MWFLNDKWCLTLVITVYTLSKSSIESFLITPTCNIKGHVKSKLKITSHRSETKNSEGIKVIIDEPTEAEVNKWTNNEIPVFYGSNEAYDYSPGPFNSIQEFSLFFLPLSVPIIAFNTFDVTYDAFKSAFTSVAVLLSPDDVDIKLDDVGAMANSIAILSVALIFSTMTEFTISSLRERLRELRISLNNEANLLQELLISIEALAMTTETRNSCLSNLQKYIERIIAESQPGKTYCIGISLLHSELRSMREKIDIFRNEEDDSLLSQMLVPKMHTSISILKELRSNRIALLQSNYPLSHYLTLVILAMSICLVFLLDCTIKDLSSGVLLKIYWSLTLGTFTTLATTSYDLRDPFQGNYSACANTSPFYMLRDYIKAKLT